MSILVNGVYWGQTGSIWVNWGQLRSIMVILGQSGLIWGHFGSIVLEVSCIKFWLSVTSGTPSKTPLSTISWLDPLRTCWFLMHTVWIVDVLEVSCFKFQLSVTSGTPSKTPLSTISWLDPWRTWLFHLHLWIGFESYHKFAPQMFKIDPLCHQYWCFILCRDTWLINYTDCLRYLYPPGGWVGGWVGLAPYAGITV